MNVKISIIIAVIGSLFSSTLLADNKELEGNYKPALRVIVDNDFGGDPDGLFHLAHQLLSPTNEVVGVIATRNYKDGFYGSPGDAKYAKSEASNLLKVFKSKLKVVEGEEDVIENLDPKLNSDGVQLIIDEAMKDDARPLYVLCGAGLTSIAKAYQKEPRIGKRIKLLWIGGPEYEGMALPPPGSKGIEYNLGIDVSAAKIVFNESDIEIWQIPRNVYRQAMVSDAELSNRLISKGPLGRYLISRLDNLKKKAGGTLGETYVLGDSPLVLPTALQSSWEKDSASSQYVIRQTPSLTDQGTYWSNPNGRLMRVYQHIDTRLMFEDFFAKVKKYDLQKLN